MKSTTGRRVKFPELLRIRNCQGQGKFVRMVEYSANFPAIPEICTVLYHPLQEICPVLHISLSAKLLPGNFTFLGVYLRLPCYRTC